MSNALRRLRGLAYTLTATVFISGLSACSSSSENNTTCDYTYQCLDGYVCVDRLCVEAGSVDDCERLGNCEEPTCEELGNCPEPSCEELGNCPVDNCEDAGTCPDPGCDALDNCAEPTPSCTESSDCEGAQICREGICSTVVQLASDYVLCSDDLDCGVGSGNCVKNLTLSTTTPDGQTSVSVQSIDASIPEGYGICTRTCTTDVNVCGALSVRTPAGVDGSYSCQVVYAGQSPFEYAQESGTALSLTAMGRGTSFAAICRPPFQLSAERSPAFCKACTSDSQCGSTDKCFIESPHAAAPSGSCVESCESQEDCSFGFRCDTIAADGPSYCLPVEDTCGRCADADGDGFGVGICGSLSNPSLGVDCDDTQAHTYYNARSVNHPFPAFCGQEDRNCNGLLDDSEQIGTTTHCGACYDTCDSSSPDARNGALSCVSQSDESFSCELKCHEGFLDCTSAPGCETEATAGGLWFRDSDDDGFAKATDNEYKCPAEAAAIEAAPNPGYDEHGTRWILNANEFDCDDEDATIYPGAREICDGIRQNCRNQVADVGVPEVGQSCTVDDSALHGLCAQSKRTCENGTLLCEQSVFPQAESCDHSDNNCDGRVDNIALPESCVPIEPTENWAPMGACLRPTGLCIVSDPECEVGEEDCERFTEACTYVTKEATEARTAADDYNCDGFIGDAENTIFVAQPGPGTLNGSPTNSGTPDAPVDTLAKALELACVGTTTAQKPCKDIVMLSGIFEFTGATTIPATALMGSGMTAVNIHGGYTVDCDSNAADMGFGCQPRWTPPNSYAQRTTIRREISAADIASAPSSRAYLPILTTAEASADATPSFSLENINIDVRAGTQSSNTTHGRAIAPTLVGILCPHNGCGVIRFKNSVIQTSDAIPGNQPAAHDWAYGPAESGKDGFVCEKNDCADFKASDTTYRYSADLLRGGIPNRCSEVNGGTDTSKATIIASHQFDSAIHTTCIARDLLETLVLTVTPAINPRTFKNNAEKYWCERCPSSFDTIWSHGECRKNDAAGTTPSSEKLGRSNSHMWKMRVPRDTHTGRGGEPGGGRENRNDRFDNTVRYFGAMRGGEGVSTTNSAMAGTGGYGGQYIYWEDKNDYDSETGGLRFEVSSRNANNNGNVYFGAGTLLTDLEMALKATAGTDGSTGRSATYSSPAGVELQLDADGVNIVAPNRSSAQRGGGGGGGGGGAGCTDDGPDNMDCGPKGQPRLYEGIGGGGGAGGCGGHAGHNGGHGGSVIGIIYSPSDHHPSAAIIFDASNASREESLSITMGSGGRGGDGTNGMSGQRGGAGGNMPDPSFPKVFQGGNGGNGGNGGGGSGGSGGISVGLVLDCGSLTRSECLKRIPSRVASVPNAYITPASIAAPGGSGGTPGVGSDSGSRGDAGKPGANFLFVMSPDAP